MTYDLIIYLTLLKQSNMKNKIFIIALGVMLMAWNTGKCYSYFVTIASATPLETANFKVQKIVEANPGDSTYLVLYTGQDTSPYMNENLVSVITKFTRTGSIVWSYKYGVIPIFGGSVLTAYSIAVDNNQNIVIGGYMEYDGATEEDFIMHLQSNGTYTGSDWFVHWNNNGGNGVTDLLFSLDPMYSNSVTAVSVDYYGTNGVNNLYVTQVDNTGTLIKQIRLDDAWDYGLAGIGLPSGTTNELKPRIVQSATNSDYYIVGTRTNGPGGANDIGFWETPYGLASYIFNEVKNSAVGHPDIFVTSTIEDEGAYSSGGHPTVYLSGYMDAGSSIYKPLLIEVDLPGTPTPTFLPLEILPTSTMTSGQYFYASDLTINKVYDDLMVATNFYNGSSTYPMAIYNVPLPISGTPPTITGVTVTPGGAVPINGGLESITNTVDQYMYFAAGEDRHDNVVLIRTDHQLDLCNPTFTTSTSIPSFSSSGTNDSRLGLTLSLNSATPHTTSQSPALNSQCSGNVNPPPGPEQQNNFGIQPACQPVEISSGVGNNLNIKMYPNPVLSMANFDINSEINSSAMLQLYDISGRVIMGQKYNLSTGPNHISMDMTKIVSGTYFLQITNEDKTINSRLQIEKY